MRYLVVASKGVSISAFQWLLWSEIRSNIHINKSRGDCSMCTCWMCTIICCKPRKPISFACIMQWASQDHWEFGLPWTSMFLICLLLFKLHFILLQSLSQGQDLDRKTFGLLLLKREVPLFCLCGGNKYKHSRGLILGVSPAVGCLRVNL